MDFILNEKSLNGQFRDEEQFLKSLEPVLTSIKFIQKCKDTEIYRTHNFYECEIAKGKRVCDLKQYGFSEELLRFKRALDNVVYAYPYWDDNPKQDKSQKFVFDGENVTDTSLAEAAFTGKSLISFELEKYIDCVLQIENGEQIHNVCSVYTPKYLLEKYKDVLNVDEKTMLEIRYKGTRIDCSILEEKYGVSILQKHEFEQLISTLDKFAQHESWESIDRDDGLEYKKFSPSSEKDNWFKGSQYRDRTIMKFRFSSVLRCYGYRKGDRFRLLRFERDHKISDKG